MEEIKAMAKESLAILKRVDERTALHSGDLHQISENMRVMVSIDANISRMATTLETVTDRAMKVLEGKGVMSLKSHLVTLGIVGAMFILFAVAVTHTNFSAETSGGSKANISSGAK